MKAIIVGCGVISKTWFRDLKGIRDIEIVGLVDLVEKNIHDTIQEQSLSDICFGSDLVDVIQRSGADTVFDCTVPSAHYGIVTTALKNGCHVLGEKPLADSMEQAREMILLARKTGLNYGVVQNRRHLNSIDSFKSLLEQGTISNPHTFNVDFNKGCHFDGFRTELKHVLLLEMSIHSFDQARFLSRADPVSVYCHEFNPPGSWFAHGASAMCIFEMSDGSVFNYRGCWTAEGLNSPWQCSWHVVGEKGSATWDGEDTIISEVPVEDDTNFIREQVRAQHPVEDRLEYIEHGGVFYDFVQSVKEKRLSVTAAEDNIRSLSMVLASILSAEQGRKVMIEYRDGLPYVI